MPPALAAEWDNTGLLVNPLDPREIQRILLTIDLTEAVAEEAIDCNSDLIVAYHPVLFRPANRLDAAIAHDRAVMRLVRADIAVYSPHTALDAVPGGVNDWLAGCAGEGEISVLQPIGESGAGQGRLLRLNRPEPLEDLAFRIKQNLKLETVRVAPATTNHPVQTIALCAGAGGDVFSGVRADCLLTGEMGHHHVLAATLAGSHVILCEHTNTERGFLPVFADILRKVLGPGIDIRISEMDADPIKFN